MDDKVTRMLKSLLCWVNYVTAYHRHGQKIPEGNLDDLANKQIEIEAELERRQAQEAPRDFTVQEFAALPKKFRDHYLRMAAELSARDMEASQAQEAPKAASVQSTDELEKALCLEMFGDHPNSHALQARVEKLIAYRAAQRQAGREEADDQAFKMLESFGVPRGRAETVRNGIMVLQDRMRKAIETEQMVNANLAKRYAAVVKALEKIEHSGCTDDAHVARQALSALGVK